MKPLPVSEAIVIAERIGLTAQLLVGVARPPSEALLSLTTTDPESELCLLSGSRYSREEVPLLGRQQSGPDTWDFPLPMPFLSDRYLLRLSDGPQSHDIPLLPGVCAINHTHGWTDDTSLVAVPVIADEAFTLALAALQHPSGPDAA
jgi:hypothetical protein